MLLARPMLLVSPVLATSLVLSVSPVFPVSPMLLVILVFPVSSVTPVRGRAEGVPRSADGEEPLGVLLLPARLEDLAFEKHARALLSIPRVVALEPPRVGLPRFLREIVSARQATRLRFPGRVRVLILYDPAQYPLARALHARTEDSELWYLPLGPGAAPRGPAASEASASGSSASGASESGTPASEAPASGSSASEASESGTPASGTSAFGDPDAFDDLARSRAIGVIEPAADGTVDDQPLRQRLRELGIISPHAFIPARTRRRP